MKQPETPDLKLRKFSFKVFIRSSDTAKTVSLYGRMSYNNEIANPFSLGMQVLRKHWNKTEQCLTGRLYKGKNERLQKIRENIDQLYSDFERTNKPFTVYDIHNAYTSKDKPLPTVLEVYHQFMDEKELLQTAGKIKKSTLRRYETFRITFANYLKNARKSPEMLLLDFNKAEADKLILYFSTNKNFYNRYNNQNYISRSFRMLQQVFRWATEREFLEKNPLQYYKVARGKAENQVFLESSELAAIENIKTNSNTLQRTIDLFLFQAYTGLAYVDTQEFDYDKNTFIEDNIAYIRFEREKSGVLTLCPLFPKVAEILKKYDNSMLKTQLNLGKYNKYLKEIAAIAGIDKVLSSHVARRTAGYMWLNSGISMEVVSRMLGHSSINETEKIYAKVLPKYIAEQTKDFYNKQLALQL